MVIPQHGQGNVAARAAEATGRAPGEPSLPAPRWPLTTRVSGERWGQRPYPPTSDTHVACTGVPLVYAAPPSATPLLRHPPATPPVITSDALHHFHWPFQRPPPRDPHTPAGRGSRPSRVWPAPESHPAKGQSRPWVAVCGRRGAAGSAALCNSVSAHMRGSLTVHHTQELCPRRGKRHHPSTQRLPRRPTH